MLVTSFALPLLVALGALGAPTPGTESQPEERGLEKHVKSSIRMAAEWDRCLVVGYRWSGIAMGPKGMECGTNYMWEYNLGETMIRSEAGPYGGPTCLKAAGRSNNDLVIFASCNNNDAQQRWWVTDDQHFALKDSGKCLDVRDGGTVMQIYDCTYNNHNQMFV